MGQCSTAGAEQAGAASRPCCTHQVGAESSLSFSGGKAIFLLVSTVFGWVLFGCIVCYGCIQRCKDE